MSWVPTETATVFKEAFARKIRITAINVKKKKKMERKKITKSISFTFVNLSPLAPSYK